MTGAYNEKRHCENSIVLLISEKYLFTNFIAKMRSLIQLGKEEVGNNFITFHSDFKVIKRLFLRVEWFDMLFHINLIPTMCGKLNFNDKDFPSNRSKKGWNRKFFHYVSWHSRLFIHKFASTGWSAQVKFEHYSPLAMCFF